MLKVYVVSAIFAAVVSLSGYCANAWAVSSTNLTGTTPALQRYCTRHSHGDYWHSCSDTRHPTFDQSHSHSGLPAYYLRNNPYRAYGFYFGVKSGAMSLSADNSDAGLPVGILLGVGRGEYTLEFEATSTSATVSQANGFRGRVVNYNSSLSTTALYAVRRIGEGLYSKMKLGILRSRAKSDLEEKIDSQLSVGLGLGLGLDLGSFTLESEYTYVGSDARFFSFGANIVF